MKKIEHDEYTEAEAELDDTTAADDVLMLVNLIHQLLDCAEESAAFVSVQIPRADVPCKRWNDIGAVELCRLLERKYENAKRLNAAAASEEF